METFCSDDMKDLAGAMLKVQAEISPAMKDGESVDELLVAFREAVDFLS